MIQNIVNEGSFYKRIDGESWLVFSTPNHLRLFLRDNPILLNWKGNKYRYKMKKIKHVKILADVEEISLREFNLEMLGIS